MKYRKEIDGLRAVAVIPVIFFHAGFSAFRGGYVGVDIFFVISGYLISSIIVREIEQGSFSILHFYERRMRRILPALFLVLIVCIPAAWFFMMPSQLKDFSASMLAVLAFASNIFFWKERGDYFGFAIEELPLLHTWSLAVEEQFYLIFPIFLVLFWRTKWRYSVTLLIFTVGVFSLMLADWGSAKYPIPTFYLTATRAWELMIGALTAIYLRNNAPTNLVYMNIGSIVGFLLIVYSIGSFDDTIRFPSLLALIPTFGAALIILFADRNTVVGSLLSNRYFVGVGLISYSAYLWHQPLFSFAHLQSTSTPSTFLMLFLVLATLMLSIVSWKLIEQPFRNKSVFTRNQIFIYSGLATFIIFMVGLFGYLNNGFYELKAADIPKQNRSLLINYNNQVKQREQFTKQTKVYATSNFAQYPPNKFLIIGDSHGKDLFNAFYLNKSLYSKIFQFRWIEFDEKCIINVLSSISTKSNKCQHALSNITDNPLVEDADKILFSTRWTKDAVRSLPDFFKFLKQKGKKLVILGRTAEFHNPPQLAWKWAALKSKVKVEDIEKALYFTRNTSLDQLNHQLSVICSSLGIPYIDKTRLICNNKEKRCDFVSNNLKPFYLDYGHWTRTGARHFGKKMLQQKLFRRFLN